ncbi:gliding motility-associated C-terminal domain-containing protein [Hyphobacterium sp. CCMP332]|nr:gliding motility-associated C-terminal domain-containing protein [Hyphobacterium sp. CCMP332]
MKWKHLLIPFILFQTNFSFSTHIVGGEIELVHDTGYFYTVNLIMYFDEFNGNPQAKDNFLRIGIFRQLDDVFMDSVFLPKVSEASVPYSFPDCSIAELNTSRIIYSAQLELDPNIYTDINGYYMVWDRCCRNNNISNLLSPGAQGQAFYLEFPPVNIGGTPFINSSPVLFPPVSDYACLNEFFYFDFSGTDPDGDSLVYSMAEPIRGWSSVNNPSPFLPFPGPYPTVIWQSGFDVDSMIPGNPPLNISPTGFLTVRPNTNGLFVFSVKCEEYRNGVKIGEIRRDFQIIVRTCPNNQSPVVSVQDPVDSTNFNRDDTMYIDLNNRCFDIFLKDPDPNTAFNVEINALNFDPTFISVSPANGLIPGSGDSLKATVCFNKCANSTVNEPYLFEIIMADDGCSLPKKDTFLITAIVDAITDNPPMINSSFIGDSIILEVGDTLIMNVNGFDTDNDTIILYYGDMEFNPQTYGMQFSRSTGVAQLSNEFFWVPDCNALDLNGKDLVFRVSDFFCSNYEDFLTFPLKITTDNKKPVLESDLGSNDVDINIRDVFSFNLSAIDTNTNDILLIRPKFFNPDGSPIQNLNYTLTPTSARGQLQSTFTWQADCSFLNTEEILFQFELLDNGCEKKSDTISFNAELFYENESPDLSIVSGIINGKKSFTINTFTDSVIALEFAGEDVDLDLLNMRWEWQDSSSLFLPISFSSSDGIGNSEGEMIIGPALCSELEIYQTKINVILKEESCLNLEDTIELSINVEEFYKEIKVPDVFTPNGDGYNDYFYPQQLPKQCQFADITIYNRWGREVYRSENADFKWDAANVPAGDYFFQIRFDGASYKGPIKVIK